jgi:hypothetical protein
MSGLVEAGNLAQPRSFLLQALLDVSFVFNLD